MTNDHPTEWLRTAMMVLCARARIVLAVVMLCAIGAFVAAQVMPSIYTGGFSILIKAPEVDLSLVGQNADVVFKPGQVAANLVADEFQILMSYGLAEAVAQAYIASGEGLPGADDRSSAFLTWLLPGNSEADNNSEERINGVQQLTDQMSTKLTITPVLKSDVIKIEMRDHDRRFLEQVLSLFASEYLRYREKIWFNQDARKFYVMQADESRKQWVRMLDRLRRLKSETNEIAPAVEKRELEKRLAANIGRLEELNVRLAESTTQLENLRNLRPAQTLTFLSEETVDNRLFWQLKAEIAETVAQREALSKDHLKTSPAARKMALHLAGLYREYKAQTKSLIENTMHTLRAERDALLGGNTNVRKRLLDLEQLAGEVGVMEQQSDLLRRRYEVYKNKAMEIDVQTRLLSASGGAIRIISPPLVGLKPVWPNTSVLIIAATVLGLFLSLLATTVQWVLKDTFSLPEEVSRDLALPVLASLPFATKYGETDAEEPDPGDKRATVRVRFHVRRLVALIWLVFIVALAGVVIDVVQAVYDDPGHSSKEWASNLTSSDAGLQAASFTLPGDRAD